MEVWDIYFSGLVGWSWHPGYLKGDVRPSIEDCADIADEMMKVREKRCLGLQQEPQ